MVLDYVHNNHTQNVSKSVVLCNLVVIIPRFQFQPS